MLEKYTYKELLELRMQLNQKIDEVERIAFYALTKGEEFEGFKLKAGRKSRYISDISGFTEVLKNTFDKDFDELCMTHKIIALTKAEQLIKDTFDEEDSKEILKTLAENYSIKVAEPTLVYTGV